MNIRSLLIALFGTTLFLATVGSASGVKDDVVDDEVVEDGFFDQEYFNDLSDEERRRLRDYTPYETPRWWGRYKKLIGRPYIRTCSKWIIDHEIPPRSGSLYCPKFTGNYTCFFGEQRCAENGRSSPQPHPKQQCTCVDRNWRCRDWKCPEPFFYTCPKSPTAIKASNNVCLGDMECPYNDDGIKCDCIDGKFECREVTPPKKPLPPPVDPNGFFIAVMLDKCPDDPLADGSFQALHCLNDMKCTYGEEKCCGETHPSLECSCLEGQKMTCSYTEACLGAFMRCPDQYPFVEPQPVADQAVLVDDPVPVPGIADQDQDIDVVGLFPPSTPPPEDGQACTDDLDVGQDCHCCGSCVADWKCACTNGRYACQKTFPSGMVCVCDAP